MTGVFTELEELADRYAPDIDIPTPPMIDQVRRNVALRARLLAEFGAVDAEEVADLVQSAARRRTATVENWRRACRVVAVRWLGRTLVPGFQLLKDGQPDPNLRPVFEVLHEQGFGDWESALWWTVPSPALDGARPVDLLLELREREDGGAERLVAAARRRRDWF